MRTESVFAKLSLDRNKCLFVGALYRPPSSDSQYMEDLCTTIDDIGQRFRKAVIWLEGDLNLTDINWNTNTVDGSQNATQINNRFLDVIHNWFGAEGHISNQEGKYTRPVSDQPSLADKQMHHSPRYC